MSPFISRAFDNLGIIFPSLNRGTFLSITTTLDSSKNEGNAGATAFTFSILRTGNLNVISSVNWVVNVTGLTNPDAPNDFVGGSFPAGTANFAIGVDRVDITVNVAGDTVVEPDENFNVILDLPIINAKILPGQGSTSGIIINDDVPPPPPPPPPPAPPPPPTPAAFTYPLQIGVFCVGAGGGGGRLTSPPSGAAGGGAGGAVANQPAFVTLPTSGQGFDILVNCGTGGGESERGTFSAAAITPSASSPTDYTAVIRQVTAAGGGGGGAGGLAAGSDGDPGVTVSIQNSPIPSRTAPGSLRDASNGAGGGGLGSGGFPGGRPGQNSPNDTGLILIQSGGGGAGSEGGAPAYTFPNAGPGGAGNPGSGFFPSSPFPLKRVNGYGGGGGGGTSSGSGSGGSGGGTGGGQGGSVTSGPATSGVGRSGTGGGGGYNRLFSGNPGSSLSGSGGPGVVYIRHLGNSSTNTILTSLSGCSAAVSPNGYVYIRFNDAGQTRRGLK